MKKRTPGIWTHVLLTVLALLLVACVTLTGLCWQAARLTWDRQLYLSLTRDSMPMQLERVYGAIDEVAQTYHFSAETARAVVGEAELQTYWTQVVDWFLNLLSDSPDYQLPVWEDDALVEAVRLDAEFQQYVEAVDRRNVARDAVAGRVGDMIERTMMPLRMPVIAKGFQMVAQRIPVERLVTLLRWAPLAMLGASVVLCLLMLLLCVKCPARASAFIGSGLLGGAGLTALVMLAVHLLDVAGGCAVVSEPLAVLASALGNRLGVQLGIACAVLALVGAALLAVHQRWLSRPAAREGYEGRHARA